MRAKITWMMLAAAVGLGCDDKTHDRTEATATTAGDPLFLIQSRIFPPEGTIGLLTPTDSLDAQLDYRRSIEQAGGGVLYAEPGVGTFMIGSGEEPSITRYDLAPDGSLVPGTKM
jgi:hypothetical protein